MKKPLLVALLSCASGVVLADEPARSDLFFGPSYIHVEGESLYGGEVAYAHYFGSSLGAVLDASYHIGSSEGLDLSELNLLAGPRYAFNRSGSWSFFAQALFGLRRDSTSFKVLDVTVSEGGTRFGIAAGGGVDIRLSPKWAVRVGGDYLWSKSEGESVNGFRASAGAVYRFGPASPPKQPSRAPGTTRHRKAGTTSSRS
jgi:opacity protein-like surface antigen